MSEWREALACAAGLFNGEGYVGFQPRSRKEYGALKLSIAQNDRRVLDTFRETVGLGTVRGPYGPYRNGQSEHWQYNSSGFQQIQAVMAMLWPWLCEVKRRQARQSFLAYRHYQERIGSSCARKELALKTWENPIIRKKRIAGIKVWAAGRTSAEWGASWDKRRRSCDL